MNCLGLCLAATESDMPYFTFIITLLCIVIGWPACLFLDYYYGTSDLKTWFFGQISLAIDKLEQETKTS